MQLGDMLRNLEPIKWQFTSICYARFADLHLKRTVFDIFSMNATAFDPIDETKTKLR